MKILINPQNHEILPYLISQPSADLFHHPHWLEFLAACYGYIPRTLVALDESDQIIGYLPLLEIKSWLTGNRLTGLPFSDFCSPVVKDESVAVELVKALMNMKEQNRWRYIKVYWPLPKIHPDVLDGERVYRHTTKLTEDSSRVFLTFDKSQVQRSIRQAEKQNLKIRFGKTWEDMQLYYSLHTLTRQRLGVPVQPIRFFRLLWDRIILQKHGFVLLAFNENRPVAGAIFLHFNHTLTYKFGASDSSFWKLRPNHLIFWRAINWGCENGFQIFDWGRTDITDSGLREFKQRWGSEEQLLNYSILSDRPYAVNQISQKHILQQVIQKSPLWVSRLIGELLYVHYA